MQLHFKNMLMDFRGKFTTAVPVIVFFLLLFYTIVFLFGTQYALVVSFVTATFRVKLLKTHTVRSMLTLFLVQMLLCVLAFFATLNLLFCILLNIAVPFILIYLQTIQFNPKGYFTNAMEFVFLQLRPVGWDNFLPLLGIMAYASLFLIAGLVFYSLVHRKQQNYSQVRHGLSLLSSSFAMMAEGQCDPALQKDMVSLHTALNRMAYTSRDFSYVVRGEGKIHYMFALLFQRAVYFMDDFSQSADRNCARDAQRLQTIAVFLDTVQKNMGTEDHAKLVNTANILAEETDGLTERFAVFIRNFMHLLALALESMAHNSSPAEWRLPAHARPLHGLKYRLRLDTFEVRFALRLCLVSTISFAVCRITESDHAYWLPLNAFLLVQPMYEESAYRMKTRTIGTLIGCAVAFFVLPLLPPGILGHMIFATVMISFMYCSTPGTWVQPIFATAFALSLASLTISGQSAIELRLFYLALAVVLVLVVNRFFFPTSQKGQFNNNVKELFHIQHSYLFMLHLSTRRSIDYGVVASALITFHMLYDDVRQYIKSPSFPIDTALYEKMLSVMWRMTAEAEQLIFYLQNESLSPRERDQIDRFALNMDEQLQGHRRDVPMAVPSLSDPYISHLLQRYAANLLMLIGLQNELPVLQ
ncbi:FUSC family protein [Christensenella timonensis]|uniref:FUSC family protein n=1 Tax=Christensenella timonensis TaxID=1816678 RepID=UPI0009EE145B|nr:FUSC family protein [Christensenella timonensis]